MGYAAGPGLRTDLRVHDGYPQLTSLDGLAGQPLGLVGLVECLELIAEHVRETGGFVGAEQAPVPVFFYFIFLEGGNPETERTTRNETKSRTIRSQSGKIYKRRRCMHSPCLP